MTRCFELAKAIACLLVLVLATRGQAAESYRVDAFGVVPLVNLRPDRAAWTDIGRPPAPVAEILPFIGQKSLVAGQDVGHGVAILLDRWGNMAADGTPARFTLASAIMNAPTRNGIADVLFFPDPIAGTYDAGVSSGDIQSARAMYRVTADLASLHPKTIRLTGDATLESFVEFSTERLADKFGNLAPSGTGGQMLMIHGERQFSLMTPVVKSGRQRAYFLIRDIPAHGRLTATLANAVTAPVDFQTIPNSLAGPSRLTIWPLPDLGAVRMRIGPVITDAGHFLNDGANISVTVRGHSGRTVTVRGWLKDGYFQATLAIAPTDLPLEIGIETPLGPERAAVLHLDSANIDRFGAQ